MWAPFSPRSYSAVSSCSLRRGVAGLCSLTQPPSYRLICHAGNVLGSPLQFRLAARLAPPALPVPRPPSSAPFGITGITHAGVIATWRAAAGFQGPLRPRPREFRHDSVLAASGHAATADRAAGVLGSRQLSASSPASNSSMICGVTAGRQNDRLAHVSCTPSLRHQKRCFGAWGGGSGGGCHFRRAVALWRRSATLWSKQLPAQILDRLPIVAAD